MNARIATVNSQTYGGMIRNLVKAFEQGDIPDESQYDACYEYFLAQGLFWQEASKICGRIELLADLDAERRMKATAPREKPPVYWSDECGSVTIPEND